MWFLFRFRLGKFQTMSGNEFTGHVGGNLACFARCDKARRVLSSIGRIHSRFDPARACANVGDSGKHMFEIVLYQPEIPPNTGNIMRVCANTGCRLHLVRPLGFSISDRHLARAGMDYREWSDYTVHDDWQACLAALGQRRLYAITTRGSGQHDRAAYNAGDVFVFGPETRGLPEDILATFPEQRRLRIPMTPRSRSLNLANAVAVIAYEAWRQHGFPGAGTAL
jgi:tRNA (cytidine/uridine-2'-O-)-methyltransferase